ncbi:MAG TPA: UGSC family (seleno)protein [Acidimicrobiales bacterium]|nr:UGSC family (seleno)protein [Acidimicrobiales bacterium]
MGSQIMDPTGRTTSADGAMQLAPRPESLSGRTVGMLDNGKQNAGRFVEELGQVLVERYGIGGLVVRKKPVATVDAPAELLSELAGASDLVVIGVGDCGSCSAAAVADAIALERLGTPAAVVCTESFKATADAMAVVRGAAGYRYATVEHPMAGLSAEQVRERAEGVADHVASLLVDTAVRRGAA